MRSYFFFATGSGTKAAAGQVWFLLAVIVYAAFPAFAAGRPFAEVGGQMLLEPDGSSEHLNVRYPLMVRGGYSWQATLGQPKRGALPLDGYLEYSAFKVSEGEGNVSVRRIQHSWLAWGRYRFSAVEGGVLTPIAAIGAGLQYANVKTSVADQVRRDDGEPALTAAAALGVLARISESWSAGIELRSAVSEEFDLNSSLGAAALVGITF